MKFYTAETKSTHIIAYADTHLKNRHFKITYSDDRYFSWKRICGKYHVLGEAQSLEGAQKLCEINN